MPLLRNKIVIYLVSRYFTYGIQFFISLIIAAKLGPYYLGVYGMVQLILSYFDQINLGIPHSLNVLLVHNKNDKLCQDKLTLNSLALFSYLCVAIALIGLICTLCGYTQFGEYDIGNLFLPIFLIVILTYYNSVYTIVIRFWNQVTLLSLIGSLPVLANICVVFFFKGKTLVNALVYSTLVSSILTTIVFYLNGTFPDFKIYNLKYSVQKQIINKGIYLFLYNSCFYFILIIVRTIISANYTVEEFGYFTFSFTIANAVLLLLNSLNTIIFPKTIDILSGGSREDINSALGKLRVCYVTTSHMLIYLALIAFPMMLIFFPQYKSALESMNMIALAVLMNANSYGYNTLLIAHNKEKLSSIVSFVALVVSIIVGLFLVYMLKVPYYIVIFSVMVAYLVFSYLSAYFSEKILYGYYSHRRAFRTFFPYKLLIPYVTALLITIFKMEYIIWIPFFMFIAFNIEDLSFLKDIAIKMLKNPNIIDVK